MKVDEGPLWRVRRSRGRVRRERVRRSGVGLLGETVKNSLERLYDANVVVEVVFDKPEQCSSFFFFHLKLKYGG